MYNWLIILLSFTSLVHSQAICSKERLACFFSQDGEDGNVNIKVESFNRNFSYVSFGFGTGMHDADVYVIYPEANGQIKVSHRQSTDHKEPEHIDFVESIIDNELTEKGYSATFTIPADESYTSGSANMIWAIGGEEPVADNTITIHADKGASRNVDLFAESSAFDPSSFKKQTLSANYASYDDYYQKPKKHHHKYHHKQRYPKKHCKKKHHGSKNYYYPHFYKSYDICADGGYDYCQSQFTLAKNACKEYGHRGTKHGDCITYQGTQFDKCVQKVDKAECWRYSTKYLAADTTDEHDREGKEYTPKYGKGQDFEYPEFYQVAFEYGDVCSVGGYGYCQSEFREAKVACKEYGYGGAQHHNCIKHQTKRFDKCIQKVDMVECD